MTIVLEFDHDVTDLALGLYSWSGSGDPTQLAYADSSTLSGPAAPGDLEEERIEDTLAEGTYYLWVHGSDSGSSSAMGASYSLQWVAGLGDISIGLE